MVTFWVSILALSIVLFGLLYQFELGVGILLGFERKERRRDVLLRTVAPIWRGNETWFTVAGIVLCAAFPVVYATLLSAFYVPFLLMLAALILRGVATELRDKTERRRWLWNAAISGASLVAAFMQGLMLGTLVEGLIISRGEYSRDEFGWWSLLAVLCGGGGLCIGYALLGVSWLVQKYAAHVRAASYYRLIPALSLGSFLALVFVFVYTLAVNLRVMTHGPAARAAYPHAAFDRSPANGVRLDRARSNGLSMTADVIE
jgi:cytochrome bd ubiquinol oxidase subunit II